MISTAFCWSDGISQNGPRYFVRSRGTWIVSAQSPHPIIWETSLGLHRSLIYITQLCSGVKWGSFQYNDAVSIRIPMMKIRWSDDHRMYYLYHGNPIPRKSVFMSKRAPGSVSFGGRARHYGDVIMGVLASQVTSLTIVYSTVNSGEDQRKHQSFASLAFVRGIHRWPVNSPHKWPVTRKMFPFDDVIMGLLRHYSLYFSYRPYLGGNMKALESMFVYWLIAVCFYCVIAYLLLE